MDKSKIFCNVPWFEVHINADGTYHTCGAQPNRMTGSADEKKYNVFNMDIQDWINSEYQCLARTKKLNGVSEILCDMCYKEESSGSISKRHKELLKSQIVIDNFDHSFQTSPDYHWFEYSKNNQGLTNYKRPTSYHISLGNEC